MIISRARKEDGSSSLLLASLASERKAPVIVARLRHAHTLRKKLDFPGTARPLELIEFRGQPTLLMEDAGGHFLSQLLGQPLPVQEFLRLGIGIAAALGELHRRGFVHKDIKPTNLIVNRRTGEAWLAGFGLTSRPLRHRRSPQSPETIVGEHLEKCVNSTRSIRNLVTIRSLLPCVRPMM